MRPVRSEESYWVPLGSSATSRAAIALLRPTNLVNPRARDTSRRQVFLPTARSWKVKRVRANPHFAVAVCDAWGTVWSKWIEGSAHVITDPERERRASEAESMRVGEGLPQCSGLHRLLDRPLAARCVVRFNEVSIGAATAAQSSFRMAHERLD